MKKRILSLFLSLLMTVFSMIPLTVYAAEGEGEQTLPVPQDEFVTDPTPVPSNTIDALMTPDPSSTPVQSATPDPSGTSDAAPGASNTPGTTGTSEESVTPSPTITPEPSTQMAPFGMFAMSPALMSAGVETVSLESTLGTGSAHDLNLVSTTSYNLTIDITAQSLTTPKLVITVPKNFVVSYYPDKNNATLASSLAPISNPVTVATDTDGNKILTYYFKANVSTVGFNITLAPNYKLKTGNSYTVSAVLFNDTVEQNSASDTVTITGNPTLLPGAYANGRYQENVILKDSADYYYARAYSYMVANYSNRYDYDSLEVIVPLPDAAEPGYYDGSNFVPLTEDVARSFTNGTMTYDASYDFVNASGTTIASGKKAVIYRLSSAHPLVSGPPYNAYFLNDAVMGGLYLRFPGNMTAGYYQAPCSIGVHGYIDGDTENYVWLADYTANLGPTIYNFKPYALSDYFYQVLGPGSVCYSYNNVLNIADNHYFSSSVYNTTGETIENIEMEYTIPAELNCYKIMFYLDSDANTGKPTSAVVQYKTKNNPTLQTVTKTVDDSSIILSDTTDAITYLHVVYDKMVSKQNGFNLMNGYLINSNNVDSATQYPVYAQILSATPTGSLSGITIGAQNKSVCGMYLKQSYPVIPGNNYILSSSSLSKGDTFCTQFILSSNQSLLTNPCIYVLMPSEFIFSRYQSPYAGAQYTISQKSVAVTAETATTNVPAGNYTLYTIKYTGDKTYQDSYNWHYMYFTVGPEVDTATLRTGVHLPAAIAVTNENLFFPYSTTNPSYLTQDKWDFDGDGNTTETLPTFYSQPTATINAVRTITAQSFLTSSYAGSGENTSQSYQYNSTGNYKLYIYNGLESGNTAKNAAITINIPKTAYPNGGITSAWNVKLTGPPVLNGTFLAGATVTYSTDGRLTYASSVSDYALVTNIKIQTASDALLENSKSASIVLPFEADFPSTVNASSNAYFSADFNYYLNDSTTLSSTDIAANMLSTAPVSVSGSVFKDYNADGIQGSDEQNNYKSYPVSLYSGGYTSGLTGLTLIGSGYANYNTGVYSFSGIYSPGTYTVKVTKENGEQFPSAGLFTQDGTTNDAYYTFTVGDDVTSVGNVNLGIVAPRTISLNNSGITLYYQGAARKIVPTITPALSESETVTYTSSDENVVTVAADGTLTYVGDGNATITVSAPQLPALIGTFGSAPVTATAYVYARHTGYSIVYKDHSGVDITASLPADYSGAKSYTYNTQLMLPSAVPYTRAGYNFGGWYTALTGGSRVNYIYTSTYGDQTLYARWIANQYTINYQGMAGASFGTNRPTTYIYNMSSAVSNPTKAGYNFAGWTINGGSEAFKDLTLAAESYTDNITLTATWTLADPSVTLTSNAAGNTITYGSNITVTATASHALNPAYTYAWYKVVPAGTDVVVGTNNRLLTLNQVAESGDYYCIVSISDGVQNAQKQSGNITVTINRASASVTNLSDISKVYSGTAVNAPTYTSVGDGAVSVEYKAQADPDTAYNLTAPVDSGDYTVRISAAQGANYYSASATRDFSISKKTITVTPQSGQTKVYGEADPMLAYTTNASTAVIGGQTIVISGAPVRTPGENVGNYAINLGSLSLSDGTGANAFRASNYTLALSASPVNFAITNASMSVTASGYSGVYDAQNHFISVTAPEGATVSYRIDGEEWSSVNPGYKDFTLAKTVYYKVEKANYTTVEGSEMVTVTKRSITITADSNIKTYDGTALTDSGYSITSGSFMPGEGFGSVTVEGSQVIVGTGNNIITAYTLNGSTQAGNYAISTQMGSLTVTQASIAITITADSNAKIYDGTDLTDNGWLRTAGTLATGDTIESVSVSGVIKNYGSVDNTIGDVVIKHDGTDVTANYNITKSKGTLTINKRAVTIAADSNTKIYDGTALADGGYHITSGSFPTGEGFGSVTVEGSQTIVGFSDNTITAYTLNGGTQAANYSITTQTGTLTVTQASIDITIAADSDLKIYDGTVLNNEGWSLAGGMLAAGDTIESVAVSGGIINYGTVDNVVGDVVIKHGGTDVSANYSITKTNGTLTINRRAVAITADSGSKVYDGTELTSSGYSITSGSFVPGEGFAGVTVVGSQTIVGSSDNVITAYTLNDSTQADNYTITEQTGTLTVTQASIAITITADSNSRVYDGTKLSDNGWLRTAGTLASGDTIESVGVSGERTYFGTADNEVGDVVIKHGSVDVTDNYIITKVDGTLTVNKRTIGINADNAAKMYDGTPLRKDSYQLSGGTLPVGDTLEVGVVGSITDFGTAANTIASVKVWHGTTDVTESYDITTTSGTLGITKRNVYITANHNEKVYDGTELGANGYTLSGDNFIVGEGLESVVLQGDQLFPGTSGIDVTSHTLMGNTKGDNYSVSYVSGTLTVQKAAIPIRIAASDKTAVYAGEPLSNRNYAVTGTLAAGDTINATVTGTIANAGTANNVVTNVTVTHEDGTDVTENYAITRSAGTLRLEPMSYSAEAFAISGIGEQNFTGKALTPEPTVNMGGTKLVKDQDYTLSYSNNSSPGTATLTISFIGNYSGTTSIQFPIAAATAAVMTEVPADITKDAATLKGSCASSLGNAEMGFYYKAASDSQYTKIGASGTPAGFEKALNNLVPDTVYVYHAFVIINGTEYAGKDIRFQTAAQPVEQQGAAPATGQVDIEVINATGQAFSGTISIENGNTVMASAMVNGIVGKSFSHSFTELKDGQYNIVVRIGDFTETKKVRIINGETEKVVFNITSLTQNSVVEVRGAAPQVAVGGITEIFNNPVDDPTKGVSQEELDNSKDIEIRVVVDEVSAVDQTKADEMGMIEDFSDGTIGMFIDFSVIKTVTYNDGSTQTRLSELPGLLEIAIPIPDELKGKTGYVIYRVHEGEVQAISETPNTDGEFIEVTDDGYILLHVKKFSTYAIGYSDVQTAHHSFNWWWLILVAVCLMLIIFIEEKIRRKRRGYAK